MSDTSVGFLFVLGLFLLAYLVESARRHYQIVRLLRDIRESVEIIKYELQRHRDRNS